MVFNFALNVLWDVSKMSTQWPKNKVYCPYASKHFTNLNILWSSLKFMVMCIQCVTKKRPKFFWDCIGLLTYNYRSERDFYRVCRWYWVNICILTANIFESEPMPTPWKFLAGGPPLLPKCKLKLKLSLG